MSDGVEYGHWGGAGFRMTRRFQRSLRDHEHRPYRIVVPTNFRQSMSGDQNDDYALNEKSSTSGDTRMLGVELDLGLWESHSVGLGPNMIGAPIR